MKISKCILLLCTIVLFTTPMILSEETASTKVDTMPLPKEVGKIRNIVITLNDLALAVEYWHDAWKRGDGRKMARHEEAVFRIVSEDIKSAVYRKADCVPGGEQFEVQQDLLKIKCLLFDSIKKGQSFAYRYRLLNDYQSLMKREVNKEHKELAKNITLINEDLKKN